MVAWSVAWGFTPNIAFSLMAKKLQFGLICLGHKNFPPVDLGVSHMPLGERLFNSGFLFATLP